MKASSVETNIDLQSSIVEQLGKANSFDIHENTALLERREARGESNPDIVLHFDNQCTKSSDEPEIFFQMLINGGELIHNCTCHKLAAICFFEWTPEGKYKQVPPIEGQPDLQYITFGVVERISVDD